MVSAIFRKVLPHLVAVVTFLVINVVYFYPQLEGKVIQQGDVVSFNGMVKEAVDFNQLTGEDVLWTNAMFGGMPSYQIGGYSATNFLPQIKNIIQFKFGDPIGTFNLSMIAMYILCLVLGMSPWLGMIGAIAFTMGTNNFVLWEAGHTNKLQVLASASLIFSAIFMVYRNKQYLLGAIFFAFGMGLSLSLNHVQMTYFITIGLSIYFIAKLVQVTQTKTFTPFLKETLILGIAGLIALGPSAGTMLPTYEYSKDTMRGEPILKSVSNTDAQTSSETSGLAWNYATQWSAGVLDVLNIIVPRSAGGSSAEKVGTNSALYKDLRSRGANVGADFRAPLYFGSMGSTSGIYYYGAIVCLLFFLGMQNVKGAIKWGLLGAVIFTILLSLGHNFALLNKPMFNYFPLYSKFRAPSSILGVTAIFFAILAILGLHQLITSKNRKSMERPLLIAMGIAVGLCLFMGFVGPAIFDFSGQSDARLQQAGYNIDALITDRKTFLRNDALRSLGFILASGGLLFAFLKNKLKEPYLLLGLGALILLDLGTIGKRYLAHDDFSTPNVVEQNFTPRPVDQQIFAAENINYNPTEVSAETLKRRGNYRVLDLSISTFQSSSTSYFHNTVGGYNAAKLQRFQDIIDYHLTKGTPGVMNMLNAKYIINQQQQLQQNSNALGNAWFVENIVKVNTPQEEIDALNTINTANDAVVLDQAFDSYIGNFDPQKNGTITLKDYSPMQLVYESNTTSEQLAVFSEVWYGPDKGWQAYIDDQPVDHVRVNYLLRAVKVPAGQHIITFKFNPTTFKIGKTTTFLSSLLIALLLIGVVGMQLLNWFKGLEQAPIAQQPKKQTAQPTKARRTNKKKRK